MAAYRASSGPSWSQPQPQAAPARIWPLLLPLFVIPFVILGGFVLYAESKYAAPPKPAPPGKPGLLVWGDGVFTNKFEINSWLRLHGADYPTWKRRHPAAVKLVNGKRIKSAAAKKRHR